MTIAVPPQHLEAFMPLARAREGEATVLGEFTDNGRFEVGYGELSVDVPAPIRLAALDLVVHWYRNPEAVLTGTIATVTPMNFEFKLRRFIRPHF
jgi:hypothetical protein